MSGTTSQTVAEVISGVDHEGRRQDAERLLEIMGDVTGEEPKVWSANTIGFGSYHYRFGSGQEGDFFTIGFSPRRDCPVFPQSLLRSSILSSGKTSTST